MRYFTAPPYVPTPPPRSDMTTMPIEHVKTPLRAAQGLAETGSYVHLGIFAIVTFAVVIGIGLIMIAHRHKINS